MKVARVRLAFDDSYFSGPRFNPHVARHLHPRGRRPADQRAVGRRGPGRRRLRLPRRTRRPVPRRSSARRCQGRARGRAAGTPRRRLPRTPSRWPRSRAPRWARSSNAPSRSATTRRPRCWPATSAWPSGRRVLRGRCGVGAGGAAPARRTPSPATGCTTAAGSRASNRLTPPRCRRPAARRQRGRTPSCAQVLTGLPVAGFTGSLQYRFDDGPRRPAAGCGRRPAPSPGCTARRRGRRRDGARMAFVAIADQVGRCRPGGAALIDLIAGALGACTVRRRVVAMNDADPPG